WTGSTATRAPGAARSTRPLRKPHSSRPSGGQLPDLQNCGCAGDFKELRAFFCNLVTPKLGESGMSQVSWKGVWLVDLRRRRAANLNQGWDGSPGRSRRVDRLAEAADCGA